MPWSDTERSGAFMSLSAAAAATDGRQLPDLCRAHRIASLRDQRDQLLRTHRSGNAQRGSGRVDVDQRRGIQVPYGVLDDPWIGRGTGDLDVELHGIKTASSAAAAPAR